MDPLEQPIPPKIPDPRQLVDGNEHLHQKPSMQTSGAAVKDKDDIDYNGPRLDMGRVSTGQAKARIDQAIKHGEAAGQPGEVGHGGIDLIRRDTPSISRKQLTRLTPPDRRIDQSEKPRYEKVDLGVISSRDAKALIDEALAREAGLGDKPITEMTFKEHFDRYFPRALKSLDVDNHPSGTPFPVDTEIDNLVAGLDVDGASGVGRLRAVWKTPSYGFSGRVFVVGRYFLVDTEAADEDANRYLKVFTDGVTAPEFLPNTYDMTTTMPYNCEIYDIQQTFGDIHLPRTG